MTLLAFLVLMAATAHAAADSSAGGSDARLKGRRMPYLRPDDLRDLIGEDYPADNWVSISEDTEFLPVLQNKSKKKKNEKRRNDETGRAANEARPEARALEEEVDGEETTGAWANYNPYSVQPFVQGMSEYDEGAQAWRLLGFVIDCNLVTDDDYEASAHSSGDSVTDEGCARYVLWAAYVDLEYEGGGIGEYQYWDRTTQQWNDTSCEYAEGGRRDRKDRKLEEESRCAKMDCHLEDTHFSVLGFFKHRSYDDWMEQLFKHEGMCVWTEEEYAFMKGAREAWPKGCTATGINVNGDGSDDFAGSTPLYYDIKPLQNGRIAVGLYTDTQCVKEYPADTEMIEDIIGNVFLDAGSQHSNSNDNNYDFSGDSLAESMDRWDSAFDVWHTCHPCVAYDLENTAGDKYTSNGYYYGRRNQRDRRLGGEYNAQGDVFECYDDAGYTNVNQCMKFSAKTVMKTATFRDLSLGRHEGSLAKYPLAGYVDEQEEYNSNTWGYFGTWFFLIAVSCALILSVWNLYKVAKEARRSVDGTPNPDGLLL